MRQPDFAASREGSETLRPLVMGNNCLISSGHYLATAAGYEVLRSGGTAIDAGIAAGVALGVLLVDRVNFAGVAPILLFHAESRAYFVLDGLGAWPARADPSLLPSDGPKEGSILASVVPGAPDAWLTALERFGSLTAGEVLEPALELATKGAPASTRVARGMQAYEDRLDILSADTVNAFFPNGNAVRAGETILRPELGRVIKAMMDEEARARAQGETRETAIRRARDLFYKGWIATEVERYHSRHGGWLRSSDLAQHAVEVTTPLKGKYGDYEIHVCGFWCQGPLLLQFLNLIEQTELAALEHNSPEYLHLLLECMNLSFADREHYYGDPRQVQVPERGLLSKDYAAERARLIAAERSLGPSYQAGDAWRFDGHESSPNGETPQASVAGAAEYRRGSTSADTSYVAAADAAGNFFSATPSDSVLWAPVIPNLGFSCSGRGLQSWTGFGHPSAVTPGRRPRLTPSPALVAFDGDPIMAFGCPGGDAQQQGLAQVWLNLVHFGMSLQQAIEAPRAISWSFPNSFAPHEHRAGVVHIEGRLGDTVAEALRRVGHVVHLVDDWTPEASSVHAVASRPNGGLVGGADPRAEGCALGW